MRRITIKDVAEAAGVSPSAVSRVFTEGASASGATRAKVLMAAEKLGYRPSRLARGLAGNRTNLVTVVYGSVSDPFDASVLEALSKALSKNEMQVMLVHAGKDDHTGKEVLSHALDYSSDAVIVTAGTVTNEQAEICTKAGLPVIMIGREVKMEGVDSVLVDNYLGGQKAAQTLIDKGCSTLAFCAKATTTYSNTMRMKGFVDTASKANISVNIETPSSEDEIEVYHAARRLLSDRERPDGVFCSNDYLALRMIEAARMSNLSIPDDLMVIGFNDIPLCSLPFYNLTSLRYSVPDIVAHTMDYLSRRLASPDAVPGSK